MYRRAKKEPVFEVGIFEDRFFRLSGAQSYFACRHSLAGKLLLIVILLCIVASSCSVGDVLLPFLWEGKLEVGRVTGLQKLAPFLELPSAIVCVKLGCLRSVLPFH